VTNSIDASVQEFFEGKVRQFGATPQGLDYGSLERQQICFAQLTKIWRNPQEAASLNDYGCGYGALIDYLDQNHFTMHQYAGYDIAPGMIEEGSRLYGQRPGYSFTTQRDNLPIADFTIAGGVFNMKLETSNQDWLPYILEQIHFMWGRSQKGMAFNILTKYSDPDRMRPDLYYADPTFFFDYCKQVFSRNVALLHDYEVYEFTILVRR
jgi:hypothetical protein